MIQWLTNKLGARLILRRPPVPTVHPQPTPPPPVDTTITYRLTDPAANPCLTRTENAPPSEQPFFKVLGYVGGGHPLESSQGQAASLLMTLDRAIQNYKSFAERPMGQWARVTVLSVLPRAGEQLNAYYDRRSLCFFYHKSNNRVLYTCDSPDITVHELGHAILDYKRPEFWGVANMEIQAIHEAWSDIFSMISQLQYPEVCQALIQNTGGDLKKPNLVSSIAEQMGSVVAAEVPGEGYDPRWLRSAVNQYKYLDPKTLPNEGPDNVLLNESHNFSRILTGAAYDLIVEIHRALGGDPVAALSEAARLVGAYMDRAFSRTPLTPDAFRALAASLLRVDSDLYQGKYQEILRSVLSGRQLLGEISLLGTGSPTTIVLSERLSGEVAALGDNPLYHVEIEVPDQGFRTAIAAKQFVDHLHQKSLVGPGRDTPWEIFGKKLIRNHTD